MINDKIKDEYLKLFEFNSDSTINDIKKTYKILAKKNHPDHFTDENQKNIQEKKMAEINEAYKIIILNFEKLKNKMYFSNTKNKSETDFSLYKKGLILYNHYFDSFFQLFSKRIFKTFDENEKNLINAKTIFSRIISEFPDSQWVQDVNGKLKNIEKALETINNNRESYNKMNIKEYTFEENIKDDTINYRLLFFIELKKLDTLETRYNWNKFEEKIKSTTETALQYFEKWTNNKDLFINASKELEIIKNEKHKNDLENIRKPLLYANLRPVIFNLFSYHIKGLNFYKVQINKNLKPVLGRLEENNYFNMKDYLLFLVNDMENGPANLD